MNIPFLPDWKTPALWVLGLALVSALVALGVQHVAMADLRTELEAEKRGRAQDQTKREAEDRQREVAAREDAAKVANAERAHAAQQQELTHELTQAQLALAQERDRRRVADGRLRDVSAQLDATRDRLEAQGDAAPSCYSADQYRALLGLVAESGRLAARCGELVGEGRELVVRRDAEVKALKAQVEADRELVEEAGAD